MPPQPSLSPSPEGSIASEGSIEPSRESSNALSVVTLGSPVESEAPSEQSAALDGVQVPASRTALPTGRQDHRSVPRAPEQSREGGSASPSSPVEPLEGEAGLEGAPAYPREERVLCRGKYQKGPRRAAPCAPCVSAAVSGKDKDGGDCFAPVGGPGRARRCWRCLAGHTCYPLRSRDVKLGRFFLFLYRTERGSSRYRTWRRLADAACRRAKQWYEVRRGARLAHQPEPESSDEEEESSALPPYLAAELAAWSGSDNGRREGEKEKGEGEEEEEEEEEEESSGEERVVAPAEEEAHEEEDELASPGDGAGTAQLSGAERFERFRAAVSLVMVRAAEQVAEGLTEALIDLLTE